MKPRGAASRQGSGGQRARILAAVHGRPSTISRREAFKLLARSDEPDREKSLASVLGNPQEEPQQRSLAAIALGHIATPIAENLLLDALDGSPVTILPDVIRALGRIGGTKAITPPHRIATSCTPALVAAASFAASLIAHRFGLPGHDLSVPAQQDLLPVPDTDAQPMQVGEASETDASSVLASLAHEPYGVELYGGSMTQLRCGTDVHTIS